MLLATAPTEKDLLKSINKFYCAEDNFEINDQSVVRKSDGAVMSTVRVVKKGKRYRFEGI